MDSATIVRSTSERALATSDSSRAVHSACVASIFAASRLFRFGIRGAADRRERQLVPFRYGIELRPELSLQPRAQSVDDGAKLILLPFSGNYPKPDPASQAPKTPQIQARQQLDGILRTA